jgi:hypothetical protein
MHFEHDAVISYCWRDNEPPPLSKQEGWVSVFQEGLEFWMQQLMPRVSRIWRDVHQMPGNKVLKDEMTQIVGKCAILLTVTSEPYLASEWCKWELNKFLEQAEKQGGIRIENDYRVFKINKLPVKPHSMPEALNLVMGFDFYEIDPFSRLPTPIDPSFGEREQHRFIRKVYDVAVTLTRVINRIENQGLGRTGKKSVRNRPILKNNEPNSTDLVQVISPTMMESALAGPIIFIPYTTSDLRDVRDELVAELVRRNCRILPQEQYQFAEVGEFRNATAQALAQSELAIHMIGEKYGTILEGASQSIHELQNTWAADESKKRGLRRLIWLPKELTAQSKAQAAFINRLRTDDAELEGADLMQDSFEVLKTHIEELLKPRKKQASIHQHGLQIYLHYEESDANAVRPLRKFFKNAAIHGQSVQLSVPVFEGDAATARELQRQNMVDCDAVIVYWNGGSHAWIQTTLNELRKAPASGRSKPFFYKHLVYIAGKKTKAKETWWHDSEENLLDEDVLTVLGFAKTPEESLCEYLQLFCQ